MRRMILILVGLMVSLGTAFAVDAPQYALITVFRERVPKASHFALTFDGNSGSMMISDGGVKIVKLKHGRFLTFKVAPGRHIIRMRHAVPITVVLKAGGHAFIEPKFESIGLMADKFRLIELSCSDASEKLQSLKMSDPKSILVSHDAVDSSYLFKSNCDSAAGTDAVPAQTSSN